MKFKNRNILAFGLAIVCSSIQGFAALPEGDFEGTTTIIAFGDSHLLDQFQQKTKITPTTLSLTSILPGNPTQNFDSRWTTNGEHDLSQRVQGEYLKTGTVKCYGNECINTLSNKVAEYVCTLDFLPDTNQLIRHCIGRREGRYDGQRFILTDVLTKVPSR